MAIMVATTTSILLGFIGVFYGAFFDTHMGFYMVGTAFILMFYAFMHSVSEVGKYIEKSD